MRIAQTIGSRTTDISLKHNNQGIRESFVLRFAVKRISDSSKMVFGGKFRIRRNNSKASYLPRQSHEKLASDPDHGSYKLTLTSNEDCIHLPHNVFSDPIHTTKINNLPDVLPLDVQIKNAPARYGSNQNLKTSPDGIRTSPDSNDHHQSSPPALSPLVSQQQQLSSTATSPITSACSLKSVFTFQSNNNKQRDSIEHNILTMRNKNMYMSANGSNAGNAMNPTPKLVSQSTLDLTKAQLLFPPIDCTNRKSASPFLMHEQQQNSSGRESNAINDLHMAEYIAMNSNGLTPNGKSNSDDRINHTDSLKENIDTIPKLQTKLMSTRLNDVSTSKFGHDSIGDSILQNDDLLSADATTSVLQPSSESPTSNDFNKIRDAKSIGMVRPSSTKSASNQCETESQYDGVESAHTSIVSNETITSDVGSQTYESNLDSFGLSSNSKPNDLPTNMLIVTKSRFVDEFDCEKLTDDLVQQLPSNDLLRHILAPKEYKSTGDYVTGLYNPKMTFKCVKKDAATSTNRDHCLDLTENTPFNGNYYSFTEPSQSVYTKQMNASRFHREMTLINRDVCDLTKQKEELVICLTKQLAALNNDRTAISDQCTTNDLLGIDISSIVANRVRHSEFIKFRSYVDDVGHITMLLLSLSGRLARTENSLCISTDSIETNLLDEKKVRLLEQLEEAKRLKIDIDRRGKNIAGILEKSLSHEENADYDYFINSKAKLIVDLREVSDRIQLHEEQLNSLKDALVHSEC